ncbi:bifunctional diguanylate cyclase/phosphodiesterase [Agaricicola taiwanensis]|uniref:Bifunctional diguanylate cyclase/phosphodiesterase n=1 Tax=Agaricicola taiwanensis TaxID=591372 RepID=A0A8J2YEY0_9RHOB|nr:EAL domain-containing protein [Agaricicola taiwanensis]GGE27227.1 bifunctional diguanylate cyclase/phosphodiesterase [Agaricicola taiwanensis]
MSLIVILDDRSTNRNIFAQLAASIETNAVVRTFGDPIEALAWIDTNTPDLVITDYKMPTMDGATFTARFREKPDCVDVPVVVITVYEERSFRLKALEAGATDFLQSPVDHHEFVTRARNLLKLRKQQLIIKSRATSLELELLHSERSREAALRDSSEKLAQVIDTVPALISATDRKGRCIFMNAHKAAMHGLDSHSVINRQMSDIIGAERAERSLALDQLVFRSGKPITSFEEEIVDASGNTNFYLTTKSPLRDGAGRIINVLTTSLDITDRKRAESHLLHLAHHDTLTDLPNRVLLQDRLRRELARTRRGDRPFALHLLDLDHFKSINDALGHQIGDRLLKSVAERLCGVVRDSDTVARLGGDEFAILQTRVMRPQEATDLAERILAALSEPFVIDEQEITTSASLGITTHPSDGSDVDLLMKNADVAMYQAKAAGRNAYRLYAPDMNVQARDRMVLESDMRRGLQRDEFVLHYQPQIDVASGQIIGAEALLRWQHPGSGMISPTTFLPLAEENGLIVPINEWVLREACGRAAEFTRSGLPPLRVAVNLSPVQFRKQDVCQLVIDILNDTKLNPRQLELELTESILMQNTEAVARDLLKLKDLGVSFSIDDFGTGYSSLSYIRNFPVDRLKIDQCFIRNLENNPSDAAIVRAIISLGHSLKLCITAEGVETAEQAAILRAEGCDEFQGYYFGRPMPLEDLLARVEEQNPRSLRA